MTLCFKIYMHHVITNTNAFQQATEQALPDSYALRQHLSATLPDYMIPAYFVPLEKLPLTSSGKIDRKALRAPDSVGGCAGYEAARTVTEQSLSALWTQVLGREKIGVHDNFFHLGGHSLRAIRLLSLVRETLGAEISLKEIFAQPTIAGQALLLASAMQRESEQIPLAAPAAPSGRPRRRSSPAART